MIAIAVVEDDDGDAQALITCLNNFSRTTGENFQIARYKTAMDFLAEKRVHADLVFMDILMPGLTGMDAAVYFRKFDSRAKLIFVTNMASYAIRGYEVNAIDFIVKPVKYEDFVIKMSKVVNLIKLEGDEFITVLNVNGLVRLPVNSLYYVEVDGHTVYYHTDGDKIASRGTLSKAEDALRRYSFLRCNNCYLVNPKHILSVDGYNLNMANGDVLQISHPRKKTFMKELAEWLGKGNFA